MIPSKPQTSDFFSRPKETRKIAPDPRKQAMGKIVRRRNRMVKKQVGY